MHHRRMGGSGGGPADLCTMRQGPPDGERSPRGSGGPENCTLQDNKSYYSRPLRGIMRQRAGFLAGTCLAIVALAAASMPDAWSDGPPVPAPTYDPQMVEYLKNITSEPGVIKKTTVVANATFDVTTRVTEASSGLYHVETSVEFDGGSEHVAYQVHANEDGTYRVIVNGSVSDELYTDVAEFQGGGRGVEKTGSSYISLYDRKYGAIGTRLSDSYTGCLVNYGEFQSDVQVHRISVHWRAAPVYMSGCVIPFTFSHVDLNQSGTGKRYNGFDNRHGAHVFDAHTGPVDTWYSMSVNLHYRSII